ncbi:hypothetical protein PISMIDRAFT_674305, partial [Pisolithus microcarpus 441]
MGWVQNQKCTQKSKGNRLPHYRSNENDTDTLPISVREIQLSKRLPLFFSKKQNPGNGIKPCAAIRTAGLAPPVPCTKLAVTPRTPYRMVHTAHPTVA